MENRVRVANMVNSWAKSSNLKPKDILIAAELNGFNLTQSDYENIRRTDGNHKIHLHLILQVIQIFLLLGGAETCTVDDTIEAIMRSEADNGIEVEEAIATLKTLFDPNAVEWALRSFKKKNDLLFSPLVKQNLEHFVKNFDLLIKDRLQDFVGRDWVFNALQEFMTIHEQGYFFITGDPGIGKSSIASAIVRKYGALHHFNILSESINKSSDFLPSLCAQLILSYGLLYNDLPAQPDKLSQNSYFLVKLLKEVSELIQGTDEKCVIVVDALDEVERPVSHRIGENLLHLPHLLPKSVYFVVTWRNEEDDHGVRPNIACSSEELPVQGKSTKNENDIKLYLSQIAKRPLIRQYFRNWKADIDDFISLMLDKCEGNFMYLRHIIPEIEKGTYENLPFDILPKGLKNYYEDHWQRMRGRNSSAWLQYKLPIIRILVAAYKPKSAVEIAHLAKVHLDWLMKY